MAYTKNKTKSAFFQALTGLQKSIQSDKGSNQSVNEFYELEPAEVMGVILNEEHPQFENYTDIGSVVARPCFSEYNSDKAL
tara:strand:- start:222 stop:464 length:243 start_codon:yes stop_codon:yes gene_type:complete